MLFVKAVKQSLIKDWDHFEFLLCFLVENRFIRIYASFLQHQIQVEAKQKKTLANRKKKEAKKKAKELKEATATLATKVAVRKLQRAWLRYRARKDEIDSVVEDFQIVDYTQRMERMFEYTSVSESIGAFRKAIDDP